MARRKRTPRDGFGLQPRDAEPMPTLELPEQPAATPKAAPEVTPGLAAVNPRPDLERSNSFTRETTIKFTPGERDDVRVTTLDSTGYTEKPANERASIGSAPSRPRSLRRRRSALSVFVGIDID